MLTAVQGLLLNFRARLHRATLPLPFITDEMEQQHSHVYSATTLIGMPLALVTLAFLIFTGEPQWRLWIGVLMVTGMAAAFLVSRTRYYVWGRLGVNALAYILFLINAYFAPATTSLLPVLLPIFLSGYYGGIHYAIINWVLSGVLMLVVITTFPGQWGESGFFILTVLMFGVLIVIQMSIARKLRKELVDQKQALILSETRLRGAIDSSLRLFLLMEPIRDADGAVIDYLLTDANFRSQEQYGMKPGMRVSAWADLALEPAVKDQLSASLFTALQSRQLVNGEYEFPPGQYLEVQIVPMGENSLAFSAYDITDRKMSETRYLALQAEQQRVATLQNLVTSLSHDFNTRLSVIRLSVAAARSTNDPKRISAKLLRISDYTEQLISVVADMLELSRLDEATVPELKRNEVMLSELLMRMVTTYQHENPYNQKLTLEASPCKYPMWVDTSQFEVAISNLMDNAVRYSGDNGSIAVRCFPDQDAAVVEIQDSGPGISETDMPHIFERFFRGAAHRPTNGGAGLGLSIAKRIIEAHGGKIQAENASQGGAIFRITLPQTYSQPAAEAVS